MFWVQGECSACRHKTNRAEFGSLENPNVFVIPFFDPAHESLKSTTN